MVVFNEAKRGYNKEQVNEYIQTLNSEYEKLTEEYQVLLNETEEEKRNDEYTEEENRNDEYKEVISSAIIKAEMASKQIIADAQFEAKVIIHEANQEIQKINNTKQTILREVEHLSNKLQEALNEKRQATKEQEEDEG